jgi:hypothetical protein
MDIIVLEESAVSLFTLILCKVEALKFIYQTAQRHISQENSLPSRGCDDFRSLFVCIFRNAVTEVWGEWGHRSYSEN